jgi:hypothetical protein
VTTNVWIFDQGIIVSFLEFCKFYFGIARFATRANVPQWKIQGDINILCVLITQNNIFLLEWRIWGSTIL